MARSWAWQLAGFVAATGLCPSLGGCGGAAPLMHPAHALPEGKLTIGAGFSGTVPVAPAKLESAEIPDRVLEQGAFAPGIAPWLGGRYGLGNDFDAGLTYSGRGIRVDGRRAVTFGEDDKSAFSFGIGASGLLPKRDDDLGSRVGGFGGDIPLMIGWHSTADVYSVWAGARGGAEYLRGVHDLPEDPMDPDVPITEDIRGWHAQIGGLAGIRVGFRYVFAVFELGAAMHWAKGSIGDTDVSLHMFSLAPAGAIIGRF